ncbi:hypothetical protein FRC19_000493 [Serendipita sp. 401]|nr:hypothetical protein FRC19_000493 [Serendipita sp. 401]
MAKLSSITQELARTTKSLVRSAAVLHRSLGLPVELWQMILELALQEVRSPYDFCSYKTFSQLQNNLRNPDCCHVSSSIEVWKTIRLVCRTWKRLAGPQAYRVIDNPATPLKGRVKEVIVRGGIDQVATMLNLVNHQKRFTHLTTLVLCDGNAGRTRIDAAIQILLDQAALFKGLRCLSVAPREPLFGFWKKLQVAFPDLIALSVAHAIEQPMILSMERLEVLDFKPWDARRNHLDLKLSLPSLRHLSLRGTFHFAMKDFLIEHGHQLESCLFEEPPWSVRDFEETMFWSIAPNLQLFGLSRNTQALLKGPPRDYPLRHVRISGSGLDVRRVYKLVEHFSQISQVFLTTSNSQSIEEAKMIQSLKEMGLVVTEIVESGFSPTLSISKEKAAFFSALVLGAAYVHLFLAQRAV